MKWRRDKVADAEPGREKPSGKAEDGDQRVDIRYCRY
jgi:hypothetical protein